MSEAAKYSGVNWIAVPRADAKEIGAEKYVTYEHHVVETQFLIEKVRELADRIDRLNALLGEYRKRDMNSPRTTSQRARLDSDYVPYHEQD